MRRLIRLFSLFLALLLMTCRILPALAQETSPLRFRENGSFTILVISDTQDIHSPQQAMLTLLNSALDKVDADLVVLLGDQIFSPVMFGNEENTKKALDNILAPIARRGLPFAAVFGNHDDENGVSKERQLQWYQSYPGCLMTEGEELTGCGNYRLPIYGAEGERALCSLWFFDSNNYPKDGSAGKYDRVHKDQLDWYLSASAESTEENGGVPVPAYAFQHIIVPEIYDALERVSESEKDQPGVVKGYGNHSDGYYRLPAEASGILGEAPCPPDVNGGELDAWLRAGDITAAFFGHDHANDFVVPYKGIDLINTDGISFFAYGCGSRHGVRVVTLREDAPDQYETRMLYYDELTDEPMPGGFIPTLGVLIWKLIVAGSVLILLMLTAAALLIRRAVKKKRLKGGTSKKPRKSRRMLTKETANQSD